MLPDYQLFNQCQDEQNYTLTAEMTFLPDNLFFDGHFEGFVLLPAVAQLFIAQAIAEQTWGCLGCFQSLRQVKFRDPIYPNSTQQLQLDYNVETGILAFCYTQVNTPENAVKSMGKIVFQQFEDDFDERTCR